MRGVRSALKSTRYFDSTRIASSGVSKRSSRTRFGPEYVQIGRRLVELGLTVNTTLLQFLKRGHNEKFADVLDQAGLLPRPPSVAAFGSDSVAGFRALATNIMHFWSIMEQ